MDTFAVGLTKTIFKEVEEAVTPSRVLSEWLHISKDFKGRNPKSYRKASKKFLSFFGKFLLDYSLTTKSKGMSLFALHLCWLTESPLKDRTVGIVLTKINCTKTDTDVSVEVVCTLAKHAFHRYMERTGKYEWDVLAHNLKESVLWAKLTAWNCKKELSVCHPSVGLFCDRGFFFGRLRPTLTSQKTDGLVLDILTFVNKNTMAGSMERMYSKYGTLFMEGESRIRQLTLSDENPSDENPIDATFTTFYQGKNPFENRKGDQFLLKHSKQYYTFLPTNMLKTLT